MNRRTAIALFFIHSAWPLCFYFAYMYCATILRNEFNLSYIAIIHQNFFVAIVQLSGWLLMGLLSYYISPIKIVKIRLVLFILFILLSPYLLAHLASPIAVFYVQCIVVVFGFMGLPIIPIIYKHLPVTKRFTYASVTYALSRALVYAITAFGMVYMSRYFGAWMMLVTMLPASVIFYFAVQHFALLEQRRAVRD